MVIRTIPAGEFKAKCLALLDEVAASGDEIVVTKRGRVVARLVAPAAELDDTSLIGSATWGSDEDLMAPTGEPWPGETRSW